MSGQQAPLRWSEQSSGIHSICHNNTHMVYHPNSPIHTHTHTEKAWCVTRTHFPSICQHAETEAAVLYYLLCHICTTKEAHRHSWSSHKKLAQTQYVRMQFHTLAFFIFNQLSDRNSHVQSALMQTKHLHITTSQHYFHNFMKWTNVIGN